MRLDSYCLPIFGEQFWEQSIKIPVFIVFILALSPDYQGLTLVLMCLYYYYHSIYGFDSLGGTLLRRLTVSKDNRKQDDAVADGLDGVSEEITE